MALQVLLTLIVVHCDSFAFGLFDPEGQKPQGVMDFLRGPLVPQGQPNDGYDEGGDEEEEGGKAIEAVDAWAEEVFELPEAEVGDGDIEQGEYVVD